MIYVSIDIETTGLDSAFHQILSLGAIIEDTSKKLDFDSIPKFHAYINHDEIVGTPFALCMNSGVINDLVNKTRTDIRFLDPDKVASEFNTWYLNNVEFPKLDDTGRIVINAAGKNFSIFDRLFIEKLPYWTDLIRFRMRTIDPTIMFTDWSNDNHLPDLSTCKLRLNDKSPVTHNAIGDAWDIIKLTRTLY